MTTDVFAELRTTAEKLGGADAVAEADALGKRLDRYWNLPGVIKGLGKLDFSQALCDAAVQIVRDLNQRGALQQQVDAAKFETWAIIALAARSDPAVIDQTETALDGDHVPARIRELRRTTDRALARQNEPPAPEQPAAEPHASAAVEPPPSVGKVKAWLAAHPDADPAVLGPRPKQKAAATAAAVRALGQIGTPRAFEILKGYATDEPTEPLLEELKRAWNQFDRREYAAAMLLPRRGHLNLNVVGEIDGIDAVEGMTSLRIVVDDKKDNKTDLSPLARCAGLDTLQVQFNGPGMPSHIDWLRPLAGLRSLDIGVELRNTDLSPLADSGIERLAIWMDGQDGSVLADMPALTHLTVIGAGSRHSDATPTTAHPQLAEVVLTLARRGVPVTVYDFDKPWATELLPAAEAAGLQLTAKHGVTTIHRGE